MHKFITKNEITNILINYGPAISNIQDVTYETECELDDNMLILYHQLDAPKFMIQYEFTNEQFSSIIWDSDLHVIDSHNFVAFLVDSFPKYFADWRQRFDCSERILATRNEDDVWTDEGYTLADDVVAAANGGMKLLPITSQMTFRL